MYCKFCSDFRMCCGIHILMQFAFFVYHIYIYLLLPKYQRSLITHLRSGTLSWVIETRRFTNVLLETKTCTVCNNDEIEDEIHFLYVSPKLNLMRQKHFETYNTLKLEFSNLDNESKFLYME